MWFRHPKAYRFHREVSSSSYPELRLDRYCPPDPVFDGQRLDRFRQVVDRYKGKKAIIAHSRAVFADSWYLRGLPEYMMDLVLNPDLVRRIGAIVVEHNVERARQLIQAGIDIIQLGDDYAYKSGPFMSPKHFVEFVLPGLQTVVKFIKDQGVYCIKHTDGDIWSIIEPIVNTGIDCLGPLEPGAKMDLYKVKQQYGDRVCVLGNVDVDLLSRGSVDAVQQETRRLIERVAPGGGYILSSGNTISYSVKAENFLAMLQTAQEFNPY